MNVNDIVVNWEENTRGKLDPDSVEALTSSIFDNGLINPVSVRPLGGGKYKLQAGYTRMRAMLDLGWTDIPVTINECDDDLISIEENLKRKDLTPQQEGIMLRKWIDKTGMSMRDVARKINKSVTFVAQRLKAADLDPEVKVKDITVEWHKKMGTRVRVSKSKPHCRKIYEMEAVLSALAKAGKFDTEAALVLNWACGFLDDITLMARLDIQI